MVKTQCFGEEKGANGVLYGVIDIGSNTIRLVIYQVHDGQIRSVLNQKYVAGLVGYVDESDRMSREGIDVAVESLSQIKEVTEQIGLTEVFPFATASLRNIKNQREVVQEIYNQCGLSVQVLSGEEEGRYDYYGAIQSVPMENGILVDVGGGSTELVEYRRKEICHAVSVPIGSLNLYHRFVEEILPNKKEISAIKKEVKKQIIQGLSRKPETFTTLCAVGGSARSLQKLARKVYGDKALTTYPAEDLTKVLETAQEHPKKLVADVLKVSPDRIHTLLPGTIVIRTVAQLYQCQKVTTSAYGVREGYLYAILEKRGR